jgi:phosphate-selective porin OprO/OprP
LVGTSGQAVPGAANGTPFFVDTGLMFRVHDVQTFGFETLLVHGPLSFQAEAMAASVDQVGQRSLFHGNYSQVGYFLTGEHRPYDRKAAVVDRIIPNQSFGKGGAGAWEVAARFSHIDLTDDAIIGGRMDNLTFGVNWFINPYVKWEFNYVRSWNDGRDHHPVLSDVYASSDINAFGTRVQADF